MNLMDIVKGQLSSDLMGKVAGLLGESPEKTTAAMGAAVPSVLAGLIDKVSTPDGVKQFGHAIEQHDDNLLGNLGGLLSGGNAGGLLQQGGNMLSGLLGNNMLGSLSGVLSKFTGLGGNKITMLLGLVGPMLMGVLKKQQKSGGMDIGGLASMLLGQKQNVASAMPAGLGSLLSGVGGLGSIASLASGVMGSAANTASSAGRQAVGAAHDAGHAAKNAGGGLMKMLIPLVLLAALAFLAWNFLGKKPATVIPPVNPTPNVIPAVPALPDIAGKLKTDLGTFFTSAGDSLKGITDVKSAEAALPRITEMNTKLDGFSGILKSLTGDKSAITGIVKTFMGNAQPMIDKVLAIPGVKEKIGPALMSMVDKLKGMAG